MGDHFDVKSCTNACCLCSFVLMIIIILLLKISFPFIIIHVKNLLLLYTFLFRCIGDLFSCKFSMLSFAFPLLLSILVVLDYKTLIFLFVKKMNAASCKVVEVSVSSSVSSATPLG